MSSKETEKYVEAGSTDEHQLRRKKTVISKTSFQEETECAYQHQYTEQYSYQQPSQRYHSDYEYHAPSAHQRHPEYPERCHEWYNGYEQPHVNALPPEYQRSTEQYEMPYPSPETHYDQRLQQSHSVHYSPTNYTRESSRYPPQVTPAYGESYYTENSFPERARKPSEPHIYEDEYAQQPTDKRFHYYRNQYEDQPPYRPESYHYSPPPPSYLRTDQRLQYYPPQPPPPPRRRHHPPKKYAKQQQDQDWVAPADYTPQVNSNMSSINFTLRLAKHMKEHNGEIVSPDGQVYEVPPQISLSPIPEHRPNSTKRYYNPNMDKENQASFSNKRRRQMPPSDDKKLTKKTLGGEQTYYEV